MPAPGRAGCARPAEANQETAIMIRGSALAVAVLAVLCWGMKAPADDKKKDEKSPGYIGVMIKPAESGGGVEVVEVVKDGPAEKAGLKAGDVIKKAGDK